MGDVSTRPNEDIEEVLKEWYSKANNFFFKHAGFINLIVITYLLFYSMNELHSALAQNLRVCKVSYEELKAHYMQMYYACKPLLDGEMYNQTWYIPEGLNITE